MRSYRSLFFKFLTLCVFTALHGMQTRSYDEKRVGDFLLVLIELYSLDRTAEALRAIIGSKSAISLQRGPFDPKFQVEGVAPTNHSSSHKTRLNYLSRGIKIWTKFFSVLSQCTRLTDGQTDRRTDRQNSHRYTATAFHAAR